MNNIRTIAERVDSFLKNTDLTNSPTLQQIYKDYAEGIAYLNERLAQCEALLQQNKAGEAVVSAEKAPSLFTLIPIMQAIDIVSFFDICQLYGLEPPPLLNVTVYQALENALNDASTKDGLLAELRKLSRTQGSEEKVIVLRKLMNMAPEDPEWPRQLQQAEASCVPALIQKAKKAIIDNDFKTLEDLDEALALPGWRVSIPSVVLEKIKSVLNAEHQRQLQLRAQSILSDVENAYALKSLPEYSRASGHWKMLCNIDYYLPSQEENYCFNNVSSFFETQIKNAAEENEYNDLLRRLRGYMQVPSGIEYDELEYFYIKLVALGREMPNDISGFVQEQKTLSEKHINSRRQMKVIRNFMLFVVTLLILTAGGGAIWCAYDLKTLRASLETATQNFDFKLGDRVIEKLNQSILYCSQFLPRLQKAILTYEEAKKQYESGKEYIAVFHKKHKEYNTALVEGNFNKADQIFADFSSGLKKYLKLKHFQNVPLPVSEKRLVNPANWLLAKQKKLNSDLENAFKSDDVSEIERLLEIFNKNEEAFLGVGRMEQLGADNISSASHYQERLSKLKSEKAAKEQLDKNNAKIKEIIAELEKLKDKITTSMISMDNVKELEELFKKFSELTENAKKTKPVSNEYEQVLKDMELVRGKLLVQFEKKRNIAFLLKNIDNVEGYEKKIFDMTQHQRNGKTTADYVEILKILVFQLDYLKKVHDMHNMENVSIWQNADLPYFFDRANRILVERQAKENMIAVKSSLHAFAMKIKKENIKLIAFKTDKGEVKNFEISNRDFQNSFRLSDLSSGDEYNFLTKSALMQIKGRKITLEYEKGGIKDIVVYPNVTYIYPKRISRRTLNEAQYPMLEKITDLEARLERLPESIFTREYFDLMFSLKDWDAALCPPEKMLKLYSIFLAPFVKLDLFRYDALNKAFKPFSYPSILTLVKEIYEMTAKIDRHISSWQWKVLPEEEQNYKQLAKELLEKTDMKPVENLISYFGIINEFYDMTLNRKAKPIGLVFFDDGIITFYKGDNVQLKSGEVWVMDSEGKTFLAGLCRNGEIKWFSDKLFKTLTISVALMPDDKLDSKEEAMKYMQSTKIIGSDALVWPKSFPVNVRE